MIQNPVMSWNYNIIKTAGAILSNNFSSKMDCESVGFVDCHTHLADSMFEHDIQTVVENAKRAGVAAALVCTVTPSDFPLVLRLCDQYPNGLTYWFLV